MEKDNLVNKINHLDTLNYLELKDLKEKFKSYTFNCNDCSDYEFNYKLVDSFIFEKYTHMEERRQRGDYSKVKQYMDLNNMHPL